MSQCVFKRFPDKVAEEAHSVANTKTVVERERQTVEASEPGPSGLSRPLDSPMTIEDIDLDGYGIADLLADPMSEDEAGGNKSQ